MIILPRVRPLSEYAIACAASDRLLSNHKTGAHTGQNLPLFRAAAGNATD